MPKILSFPDLTRKSTDAGDLSFLVISPKIDSFSRILQSCHSLSPQVMQWATRIWIVDLSSCLDYWNMRAKSEQLDLITYIQNKLDTIFGKEAYWAVASIEAWQALLLLKCLLRHRGPGLVDRQSPLGHNLLQALDWQDWWETCDQYAQHSKDPKLSSQLLTKRLSMQLAMRRMSYKWPSSLRHIPYNQIQRRFGAKIAELWEMTWRSADLNLSKEIPRTPIIDIPWHSLAYTNEASVSRHLDEPVSEWENIENLLRNDLNRFCLLSLFKKDERILVMEWKIVLYNLQEIPVTISFRHPHNLQLDYPQQRTALLQISYAFQQYKKHNQHEQDLNFLSMISWKLRIVESIKVAPQETLLFSDSLDSSSDKLLDLENQLSLPLESYALQEDWVPQDSHRLAPSHTSPPNLGLNHLGLHSIGASRPLFLKKKTYCLPHTHKEQVWEFKERTMEKWWRSPGVARDYYKVIHEQSILWVASDTEQNHLVLGIYG